MAKEKVSIGMPVYNGKKYIHQSLTSFLTQDYEYFELIIMDNASEDGTEEICREYMKRDSRIRYYRNTENKGALCSFRKVLELATGKYFMWASHDDIWEEYFIGNLVQILETDPKLVAAGFEAQYIDENSEKFDFFPEGKPFYSAFYESNIERIEYLLKHNYGNLIYSIYKTENLKRISFSLNWNEIPLLIQVINQGNWRVLPEIGFYKRTKIRTYEQAKWEMLGGKLPYLYPFKNIPNYVIHFLKYVSKRVIYHINTIKAIVRSIRSLPINILDKLYLEFIAIKLIFVHLISLLLGRKKANKNHK